MAQIHIAMYPWLAMGHLTSFLHLSNKLAERNHKISFFIPARTQHKLTHFNLHPHLITFIPITVPNIPGLPEHSETTSDVPYPLHSLLMAAMDKTAPEIDGLIEKLKPHVVFFDFTHWLPALARRFGVKSVHYCTISPAAFGFLTRPEVKAEGRRLTVEEIMQTPPGFPPSCIKLKKCEAKGLVRETEKEYGEEVQFTDRLLTSVSDSDAIGFKTCQEIEGSYAGYVGKLFNKPVLLAGPVLPETPNSSLDEKWANWLGQFEPSTVIYCVFGSECTLPKAQFQELVLGFELTGMPFLAALKPPFGCETIESALPDGFEERVAGRGLVCGDWVPQQLMLAHRAIGCFVTHCGYGSLSEALVNECQLVLLPNVGDQIINARMMGEDLRVGVEVEKGDESGLFDRDGVCRAVKVVMDGESEIGKVVRANHTKWREFLLRDGLERDYVDSFVNKLRNILTS
ncbi:unnamed protein product [Rhodiola kirilowii]